MAEAKTIDLTPTWRQIIPTLVMVATQATDAKSREFAMDELLRLGDIVDKHIATLKDIKDTPSSVETRTFSGATRKE